MRLANIEKIDKCGYDHLDCLTANDLVVTRELILHQISVYLGRKIDSLEKYHEAVNESDHERIFSVKNSRIFTREMSNIFLGLPSVTHFLSIFRNRRISEVVYGNFQFEKRPQVYFRLVRPGISSDVGGLHADKWFDDLYGIAKENQPKYKIWLSICSEPGLNGLYIVPYSNHVAFDYTQKNTTEGPRPILLDDVDPNAIFLPLISPGQALIFDQKTLHGGALNKGINTRVSLEIAII